MLSWHRLLLNLEKLYSEDPSTACGRNHSPSWKSCSHPSPKQLSPRRQCVRARIGVRRKLGLEVASRIFFLVPETPGEKVPGEDHHHHQSSPPVTSEHEKKKKQKKKKKKKKKTKRRKKREKTQSWKHE